MWANPQVKHGLIILLAGMILHALVSAFEPRIKRTWIKTQKSFLETLGNDKDTYSKI